jgi:hypothetical protein
MYRIVFHQNNLKTGETSFNSYQEGLSYFVACIDRYTRTHGFYTDDKDNIFKIYDLSPAARVIELHGKFSEQMKYSLKNDLNTLVTSWMNN